MYLYFCDDKTLKTMKRLALFLFLICSMACSLVVRADEPFRNHRYDSWKVLGLPKNAIVFVGNSITDMHNWNEAFGCDPRIVNRGTSGGYSQEVLENVESWVRFRPAKVFIKIGTNDLGTNYGEQVVAENIRRTVALIRRESPKTQIYLQSILPANDQGYRTPATIEAANVLIRRIAEADDHTTYVDLYSLLGGIRSGEPYSLDRLHLTAYGYQVWTEAIAPYVGITPSYPASTRSLQQFCNLGGSFGMRASYFSVLPTMSSDVLFFGDEMVKNGEWNELLHNPHVRNRGSWWGYGGNIQAVGRYVDAAFANADKGVLRESPSQILVYTGTEDLNPATPAALAKAKDGYAALLQQLRQYAPQTPICLVSLMPTQQANATIPAFNEWLAATCAADPQLTYIDIYSLLVGEDGKARPAYFMGNYLNGIGYVQVARQLSNHIKGSKVISDKEAARRIAQTDTRAAAARQRWLGEAGIQPAKDFTLEGRQFALSTPYRSNRYALAMSAGVECTEGNPGYAHYRWTFEPRPDGMYNIKNVGTQTYVDPATPHGEQLRLLSAAPAQGWVVEDSDRPGLYILRSPSVTPNPVSPSAAPNSVSPSATPVPNGSPLGAASPSAPAEWNMCNNAYLIVYNWHDTSDGTNRSDTGCQWLLEDVTDHPVVPAPAAALQSTLVQQGKVTTGIGNRDVPILRSTLQVGGYSGQLTFQRVEGRVVATSLSDVKAVRAYFATNAQELFVDAAHQMPWRQPNAQLFGEGELKADGTFTIQGRQALAPGRHYLWLALDIADDAQEGHTVDAIIDAYAIDGNKVVEAQGNPEHAATIFLSEGTVLMPMDKGSLYYRIPAICTTADGRRLVTLTDDRKNHNADLPNHCYIVAQYSDDQGRTWSEPQTVAGTATTGGDYGHGDASLITNRQTGEIVGIMTTSTYGAGFWASTPERPQTWKTIKSSDGGLTWSVPKDHTRSLYGKGSPHPNWYGGFSGSGAGLQKRDGTLVSPFVNREADEQGNITLNYYSFMSKDGGDTWYVSGNRGSRPADEPKVLERNNGDLAISVRQGGYNLHNVTPDDGQTWLYGDGKRFTTGFNGNACDGEYMVWCSTLDGNPWNITLQTMPNSTSRQNVGIALSTDEGETFSAPKTICPRGSAYSAATVLADGTLGVYYEEEGLYGGYTMRFVRFSLNWASDGKYRFSQEQPFHPIQSKAVEGKISIKQIAAARQSVWDAWCNDLAQADTLPRMTLDALAPANVASWQLPAQLEPHATMRFFSGTKGAKPAKGYPMYLYLHGSGPKEMEWQTGLRLAQSFDDAPSLYVIPQIPNEGSYYRWWQKSKQWAWGKLLRQLLAHPAVDPARLYLFGISEGGYGSQRLASYYADYLAGAAPMAGGEPLRNAPAENLSRTAFSLITGQQDATFYRNLLTQRTRERLDSLKACSPDAYNYRVMLELGKGHAITYGLSTPWLKTFSRVAQPRQFRWENFEMDGQKRNAFYNLQVLEEQDGDRYDYEFSVADNVVNLNVRRVTYTTTQTDPNWGIELNHTRSYAPATHGRVRIFLSEQLVQLAKPVRIYLNGALVFAGRLQPSRAALTASCHLFGDPLRLFPAFQDVAW